MGRLPNEDRTYLWLKDSINLAWLRQRRMLEPGRISTLTWSIGGERTGEISLVGQVNGVRLLYSVTRSDGTKTRIDELVPFAYNHVRWPPTMAHVTEVQAPLP